MGFLRVDYMASGNGDHLAKALAATCGWNSSSNPDAPGNAPSANNATGFSALPAGCVGDCGFGYDAGFWSATEYGGYCAYYRYLTYNLAYVGGSDDPKSCGFSVRCLRD